MITPDQVYESIGVGYAAVCRPDPRIHQLIVDALADANIVLNVGAGAGNYEPTDRRVVAVEPSSAMIAQRVPAQVPQCREWRKPCPSVTGLLTLR